MHRHKDEQRTEIKSRAQGGKGDMSVRHLLELSDAYGSGRLFSINTLEPGCSVGQHGHSGEFEVYYILSGTAEIYDDGDVYTLKAGDVHQCRDGSVHGIENTGAEPLEFLALILNVNEQKMKESA